MEKGVDQISHFSESLSLFLDDCSGHADQTIERKEQRKCILMKVH
jgi:hypothetical protein